MANDYDHLNKLVIKMNFHILIKFVLKALFLFVLFTIFSFFLSKNVSLYNENFSFIIFDLFNCTTEARIKNIPLRDIEILAGFNNLLVLFLLSATLLALVYRASITKNIFKEIYRELLKLRSEILNHYHSSIIFMIIINLFLLFVVVFAFNDSLSSEHHINNSRCGEMTNEYSSPTELITGGFYLGITFSIFWYYLYLSYFSVFLLCVLRKMKQKAELVK